jgi:hypothetical protein
MDSDDISIPADLHRAYNAMYQQIEVAHATWITTLVERRPELADRLWELHNRYCDRHQRLEALLLLIGVDAELPALELYAAYEALGTPVIASTSDADYDPIEKLNPYQRAALTKRTRTRKAIIDAATLLMGDGTTSRLMEETAVQAGIGVATVYHHFATKGDLIQAVYARLLEPLLHQI